MIDYDELREAHELVDAIDYGIKHLIDKSLVGNPVHRFYLTRYGEEERFYTLYDLLTKLKELTKPKQKYVIGETWWYLDEASFLQYPKPKSILITEGNKNHYRDNNEWHPSKESLIEAQIEYWLSLKCPKSEGEVKGFRLRSCWNHNFKKGVCIICGENNLSKVLDSAIKKQESCQHESEGSFSHDGGLTETHKCRKCGEFY